MYEFTKEAFKHRFEKKPLGTPFGIVFEKLISGNGVTINYTVRPKGHCTICWQSKKRGSGWNHSKCYQEVRKNIESTLHYTIPSLTIIPIQISEDEELEQVNAEERHIFLKIV